MYIVVHGLPVKYGHVQRVYVLWIPSTCAITNLYIERSPCRFLELCSHCLVLLYLQKGVPPSQVSFSEIWKKLFLMGEFVCYKKQVLKCYSLFISWCNSQACLAPLSAKVWT